MAYDPLTYDKFPLDYVVGMYGEHDLAPISVPLGGSINITAGTLPTGLRLDTSDWKLKGVATTENAYDISFDVLDSGSIIVDSFDYSIVVVLIVINYTDPTGPISYNAYTNFSDTFSYAITGPYTLDDATDITWVTTGSEIFDGIILGSGTSITINLEGRAKEIGKFLISLSTTNEVGHIFSQKFNGEILYTSPSGSDTPLLNTCDILGGTKSAQFSYTYQATQGVIPYNYRTSIDYNSLDPKIPSTFSLVLNKNTGALTMTGNQLGNWNYRALVKDKIYQKKFRQIADQVITKVACSSWFDGIKSTANQYAFVASKDFPTGAAGHFYRYNLSTDTLSSVVEFTSLVRDIAPPDFETDYQDSYVYVGLDPSGSATNYPIKEVNINTLAVTTTTTVTASSGVHITELVRSPYSVKALVLFDNDPIQSFNMSTKALAATAMSATRNYASGCVTYDGTNDTFWVLNVTDKILIKYNPISNTIINTYSIVGSSFVTNSCSREKIINFNNTKIMITDSSADKIYEFDIAGGTFTSHTLAVGVEPVGLYTDNILIYVLSKNNNVILCYNSDFTLRDTINLRDNIYLEQIYSGNNFPETITNVRGPVKKGSVVIEYHTNDWGLITCTDNSSGILTSSMPSIISNGSVDYCTGAITAEAYTETGTFTVILNYKNSSNELAGVSYRDNFQTYLLTNTNLEILYDNISTTDHIFKVGDLTLNRTSSRSLIYTETQSISDSVTISGGTPSYGISVVGCSLPAGLSITYPCSGTNIYCLEGNPTTPGVYTFTIQILDSVNNEMIFTAGEDNDYEPL